MHGILRHAKSPVDPADERAVGRAILRLVQQARQEEPHSLTRREKLSKAARLRMEAAVMRAFQSPEGMRKLAQNLEEPVKDQLDYKSITSNAVVREQVNPGEPLVYDPDFEDAEALVVGEDGTTLIKELVGSRITLNAFDMAAIVKVPWAQLTERRFKAVIRAREKLSEAMAIKYDLLNFASMAVQGAAGGTTAQALSGRLTKRGLTLAIGELRKNRVPPGGLYSSVSGMIDILNFNRDDFTPSYMEEALDTGFIGSLWGIPIYISDQLTNGYAYLCGVPQLTAWNPIRKDVTIVLADEPTQLWLGFVIYMRMGLTWHNSKAVCEITWNPTAA